MNEAKQGNGHGIAVEMMGLVVHVETLENGKRMLRQVPIPDPKAARKIIDFIKHRIHGGTLMLDKNAHEIVLTPAPAPEETEPPTEESRIIVP